MKDDLTYQIIGAAYEVHAGLGAGFLEKVYENAMCIELEERGLHVRQQYCIPVHYKGQMVGEYYADLFVEEKVIVELKAVERLLPIHEAQLVNYLQGTGIELGLLINFGGSVIIKRKYKTYHSPK